jgi:hypothetical protein
MTLASSHTSPSVKRTQWMRCSLPVLLALALTSHLVRAEDSGAQMRTMARDLADQGAQAFEQNDYAAALDRFARAFALVPAPSISIMRARALVKLGRILEALDEYEKTQRMQLGDDASAAFKQAVLDARREGELLWTRVPRLTIRVRSSEVAPKDLRVQFDSKLLPVALLDVGRPIDPGSHEIKVDAPGYETETRAFTIEAGENITLDIALKAVHATESPTVTPNTSSPKASGAAESPAPNSHQPTTRHSTTTGKPWAWVAAGIGVAGLATSGITGVVALEKKSALDAQCHPGCPPGAASDISTFRTTRTLSYASFFAGAAFLGLGGYFLLTDSGEQKLVGATFSPTHLAVWGAF